MRLRNVLKLLNEYRSNIKGFYLDVFTSKGLSWKIILNLFFHFPSSNWDRLNDTQKIVRTT